MVTAIHQRPVSKGLMEVVAIGALIGIAGCELANTVVARTDPQLVVHAVLDASSLTQYVLVEQSLTGGIAVVNDGAYDPASPIISGNGVPVSGALVTLTDPDGLVMTGIEDRRNGLLLPGVYRINLISYATTIQRGKRYALVVSARGATVKGTTMVPLAGPATGLATFPLNRDIQSASVMVSATAARAFWTRIDAPLGPYQLISPDPSISISGRTRNLSTDDLIRVFYPGFLQTMTIAAVDTNLYDYYRSGSDPFSGTGLINHLSGGLGVFGAMVIVDQRVFDVTQNPAGDSIEGRYTLRSPTGQLPPAEPFDIRLFLEARGGDGNPDRISGSHLRGAASSPTRGAVYGTRTADSLTIDILASQSTSQRSDRFRATIKGDSLIGFFDHFNLPCVFVKFGK